MKSVLKETGFAIFFLIVIALVAVEAAEGATDEGPAASERINR